MKPAAVLASIAVSLLVAYAIAGTLAAFVAAATMFTIVALWLRSRLQAPPSPTSDPPDHWAPDPRRYFSDLSRIETQLFSSLNSRRIYDHSLKPRLFRLALALLSQRRAARVADAQSVRDLVGERLWPVIDPANTTYDDEPRVAPTELDRVLGRLEELL